MYNGKTTSLKYIMWRISSHPLMKKLNYDDAAMYAIDALRLIGTPLIYENKVSRPPIEIVDYKGKLPENLLNIRGVKLFDSDRVFTYATDIYHQDKCKEDFGKNCIYDSDLTYEVQNNIITTSISKGKVVISYETLSTDEEGYPLIPDNKKVKEAIRYHIMYSHLEPLYDIGKISNKTFFRIEQNRDWYIGGAQSSTQLSGMDHLQSTMNAINRLLVNNKAHQRQFRFLQRQEGNKKYKS